MAPDKVLTAAHCVCTLRPATSADKRKLGIRLNEAFPPSVIAEQYKGQMAAWKSVVVSRAQTVMDNSKCQSQVDVTIIHYMAQTKSFVSPTYRGIAVLPHPRFLSIEDDQRDGLFREADLALIQLSEAVTQNFRPIRLPTAEVYKGQRIIMVGYGLGETEYPTTPFGFRHFGASRITKIDQFASGSTRFSTAEQEPGGREFARNYEGDSGGGGFSQKDDTVLVGIMSARKDGEGAVFESVYPHVEWLRRFQE